MSDRPASPGPPLAPLLNLLVEGDRAPLVKALERPEDGPLRLGESVDVALRLWWELSTLYGRVIGSVRVLQGDREDVAMFAFRPVAVTGGAPRDVSNAVAVAAVWTEALGTPPSREGHRRAMLDTWHTYASGVHPDPDAADCLLRHHTDLPVDWSVRGGRTPFWIDPARTVADATAEMPDVPRLLADPVAFEAAITLGLTSSSHPRRDLSWRLSRLIS